MNDHINHIFEITLGAVALVLAFTLFISLNSSTSSLSTINLTENRLYTESNTYQSHISMITGNGVKASIYSDKTSIEYEVQDTTGMILINIINCTDLTLLSFLNDTQNYDTFYKIENSEIKKIIYKEL